MGKAGGVGRTMRAPRQALLAVGRFALVYAGLVFGLGAVVGPYAFFLARAAVAGTEGNREVSVEQPAGAGGIRFVIVNRDLMAADGSGPVRNVDIDLRRLLSQSLGLLAALTVALPVSWARRGRAFMLGVVLLHACFVGFLRFSIWAESAEVGLVAFSPAVKAAATGCENLLLAQFALLVPVVVGILAGFRRGDGEALRRLIGRDGQRGESVSPLRPG